MELQLKDIELAAERLKPILHHTELDMSSTFSAMTGGEIYLNAKTGRKPARLKSAARATKLPHLSSAAM